MKKAYTICLILAVSLLASPLAVFSMEPMAEESQNSVMELSGTVMSVEEGQVVIEYQMEDQGAVTTGIFLISEGTEVSKNGNPGTVEEIKAGDKVMITYKDDENNDKVIQTVKIEE